MERTEDRAASELRESGKGEAARAAAEIVADGMLVGLGTGTTVAHLLPALAARELDIRCVATSPQTESQARALGLRVEPFAELPHLDIAIDGADQVSADLWLTKGGGGAHTREKLVACAADRFVVIVDESKLVDALTPPVALELVPFGVAGTLARLGSARLRDVPPSPDGGLIADYLDDFADPAALAERLSCTPGVVEHGLFPAAMVSAVAVGGAGGARWLERGR
ncbi:MAG TPA: ribose 5-phosphate isomerase A [Solirubrobacteraceae bacterium]|nr:ribose 5-phosphate isomerase A [Solirubrobacteraceae bacterium]